MDRVSARWKRRGSQVDGADYAAPPSPPPKRFNLTAAFDAKQFLPPESHPPHWDFFVAPGGYFEQTTAVRVAREDAPMIQMPVQRNPGYNNYQVFEVLCKLVNAEHYFLVAGVALVRVPRNRETTRVVKWGGYSMSGYRELSVYGVPVGLVPREAVEATTGRGSMEASEWG